MGIKERKEREKDEHREIILKAASEIMDEEGVDKLSIRKIAAKIEYSPAIIYHYFKNKEDIINILMKKGYEKILRELFSLENSSDKPEEKFKKLLKRYILKALSMPDEYKTVMMNTTPEVLSHTSVLFKGASIERKALALLCNFVKDLSGDNILEDEAAELTAQIVWAATFGLIIRLITEKDTKEEQKERLINSHVELMTDMINGRH
ncbi:TetR/AcrR family transcriptional regulator [Candidatus Clostridium stratigraminis]|uniref:TetR/AcrR family transcriptional regulator n=1 Tax=Candidatus Clostridium stratigraminis TaxID=3381661 RepID=A0ABW8T7Z6_9CLOT